MQPPPTPPKKKRSAKSIVISLALVAAASIGGTLIGKFVTATALAPKSQEDTSTVVSGSSQPNGGTADETNNSPVAGEAHMKTYGARSEGIVSSSISFVYQDDTVISIAGSILVFDTSVADIEGLKQDVATAKSIIEQDNLKYINFAEKETPEGTAEYSLIFSFANLDKNTKAADLAAQFIGFEAENGSSNHHGTFRRRKKLKLQIGLKIKAITA